MPTHSFVAPTINQHTFGQSLGTYEAFEQKDIRTTWKASCFFCGTVLDFLAKEMPNTWQINKYELQTISTKNEVINHSTTLIN